MDHVVRAGGRLFDGSTPQFTSDGVRRATEAFLSYYQDGVAPKGNTSMTEGNATQQFFGGNAAFMFNASSNIFLPGKELPIDKPAQEVARIARYPKPPGAPSETATINASPTGYSLSVFSTNKENAAKFMNYASGYDAHKAMLVEEGNLGLREDVYSDEEVQEALPYMEIFQDQLVNGTMMRYPSPGQMRQMVYSQTQAAIANDLSADETVQRMQSEAESIIGG
jgi:ABC-type glycerol-3-phosphate transport system substrate-binding protein